MNEQNQRPMTKEELENAIKEMKLRTCDMYRTIDMLKAQQHNAEQELQQQLSHLNQAEQALAQMNKDASGKQAE